MANRRLARQGIDPRKARKTAPDFRAVAEAVIKVNAEAWRGDADPVVFKWSYRMDDLVAA